MATGTQPAEKAQEAYNRLVNDRNTYTQRAEECAALTIPSLFPKESDNGSTKFTTPFQAVGARGLNNLASKLTLAMFPPNEGFFRYELSMEAQQKMAGGGDSQKTKTDQALALMEKTVLKAFETSGARVALQEGIKQLVLSGNCLFFLSDEGLKMFTLRNYVVERDAMGNPLTIVAQEKFAAGSLPEELRAAAKLEQDATAATPVTVFTHVYFDAESQQWQSYQEIGGEPVAGTEQSYPKDKSPWIPVRLSKTAGEHYGRGFVEEYYGDLNSLENLSKALVQMAMIASKVVWLVNPNGITQVRRLNSATNGAYIPGREEDIKPLQLQKYSDMQVAKSQADVLEARLSYAFMLNSAVQRQGERVTAEEIRYVARELEDTLGGIYSILTQELQLPYIRRLTTVMMSSGAIPDLPDGFIEPTVITGVDALGRGYDLNKLVQFIQTLEALGEAAWARLKINNVISRVGMSLGLDTTELVMTDEEVAQQQQAQMTQQVTGEAATTAANAAVQQEVQQPVSQ